MPQAKWAEPEQFVDMSFLQELDKEGFFNEMAKRYPGEIGNRNNQPKGHTEEQFRLGALANNLLSDFFWGSGRAK